ncbi:hypothetical protein HanPI659440_Chr02g0036151 [Helianthus annuus]|nr:hypothetical protein HanPI659440_Chr02g0036151 [Helianthus annuus]
MHGGNIRLNSTVMIYSFNKVGHNERAIVEVVRRQPVTAVVGSLPLREILYTGSNNPLFRSRWRHSFESYYFDRRIQEKKKTDWTIGDVLISGVQLLVAMAPFTWKGIRIIPVTTKF